MSAQNLSKIFISSDPEAQEAVWKWDSDIIKQYIMSLHDKAEALPPSELRNTLLKAYDELILPCLNNPHETGPWQWHYNDDHKPVLHTVQVNDNVGTIVELTDFYSCFGWLISILEDDIHVFANAQHHDYCKELVVKFGRFCYILHHDLFLNKALNMRDPPAQAFMLYGSAQPDPRKDFAHPEAASISASLPQGHFNMVLDDHVWDVNFRREAEEVRAEVVYQKLDGVEGSVRDFLEANQPNETGRRPRGVFAAGHCAEWIPFASRLAKQRPKMRLYGVCISTRIAGTRDSLQEAIANGHCTTPHCHTCGKIIAFVNGGYEDMAL